MKDEMTNAARLKINEAIELQNQIDALRARQLPALQQAAILLEGMAGDGAPVVKQLPVPWLSQLGPGASYSNSDCGPACVAMVTRLYGAAPTVDEVSRATGLPAGFTSTNYAQLIKAGAKFGARLQRALGLTIATLRESVGSGAPVIVLVHYASLPKRSDPKFSSGHWIVVCGCTSNGLMLYHDPYWTDTTGQFMEIADADLARAMADTRLDGNTANQGLTLIAAAG